jgi:hypothetical protein
MRIREKGHTQPRRVLHMRQHIANKAERTSLVWAYAGGAHAHCGFVIRVSSTRLPLSSAQNATLSLIALSLEPSIEKKIGSVAQVFHGVGVHIRMMVL